jgi:hypothetical protein
MILTILDPCTGTRVAIEVPAKQQVQRARRWVRRELDRMISKREQIPSNSNQ